MNACQRWTPALLVTALLLAVQSTTSDAETQSAMIGVASSITPSAEGGIGTVFQTLTSGSKLQANETVRTGDAGKADLVFIDRTNLTVGPTSEVVLDKFVYDPVGDKGKVALQATRGTFRFVTGTQDHRAYQINNPYGSLGVRGTAFTCEVKPKGQKQQIAGGCDVKCTVESGAVEAATLGGKKQTFTAGQTFCQSGNNFTVTSAEGPHGAAGPPGGGGPGGGGNNCVPQITPTVIKCD
jgi:hypothetical protein